MKYRRLGDAGMKVSVVSFGGWINYGEGKVAQDVAAAMVKRAYELEINYFDLADIYGKGEAEKQMGAVLQQYPRHTLVIASKAFWPMSDSVNDQGLSRKHIMESIDKSLKRLGTDYVDLYFCHRPDPETPILETARAMNDLIRQGKVLYWGTSEWSGAQIAEACDICDQYGLTRPQTEQPKYSMLWRERVEKDVLPAARERGVGLVVFSPLAMGMLSGKYDDGIPADSRFARELWAKEELLSEANAAKVRKLKPIADGLGITRSQLALAWALRHSQVSSTIIGATKVAQIEDNVRAVDVTIPADALAQIEGVLSGSASG